MTLSIVMVTYNSAGVVEGAIRSVRGIADELLVGDGGSTDGTVEIVRKYGGVIIRQIRPILPIRPVNETMVNNDTNGGMRRKNLGERKQELVEKAKGEWILVLDADERVSKELYQEIRRITDHHKIMLEHKNVMGHHDWAIVAYRIPYQNYVFGRPVYYGGEKYAKVRLFKKGSARISPEALHEEVIVKDGRVGDLRGVIHHHSYRSPIQLFKKFTSYASMAAEQKKEVGEHATFKKLFLYGPHMFWARYIKEKGYKDGWRGLVLSLAFGYMEGLTYWWHVFGRKKEAQEYLPLLILIGIHIFLLQHVPFLVWEEMLGYPWLMAQGLWLYRDILVMYPPGFLYILLGLYRLLGFTFQSLFTVGYLFIVVTDVVLYRIARRLFGSVWPAVTATMFYIIWHPFVEGNTLWFDSAALPFQLVAFAFFVDLVLTKKTRSGILCGLFFAISFLIKQTTVWPFLASLLVLTASHSFQWARAIRQIGSMLLVPIVIAVALLGVTSIYGIRSQFFYWTVMVPVFRYSRDPSMVLPPTVYDMSRVVPLLVVGVTLLALGFFLRHRREGKRSLLALVWAGAMIVSVFPRWAMFHLVPSVAFLSLAVGGVVWMVSVYGRGVARRLLLPLSLAIVVFLVTSYQQLKHFYVDIVPKRERFDAFAWRQFADTLGKRVNGQALYSLENVHLTYFLLDRRPTVLPWTPMTRSFETDATLQRQIIDQIENKKIVYVIYFPLTASGVLTDPIPSLLKLYLMANFDAEERGFLPEDVMLLRRRQVPAIRL